MAFRPRSLVRSSPRRCKGHTEAARVPGPIYLNGQGVAVNEKRALEAYKIAAAAGHRACQHQLGAMYYYAKGMDSPDVQKATDWFEKAAANGHCEAMAALAGMYLDGAKGLLPSFRRARELLQRATALGSRAAPVNMQTLAREAARVSPQDSVLPSLARGLTPAPSAPGRAPLAVKVHKAFCNCSKKAIVQKGYFVIKFIS